MYRPRTSVVETYNQHVSMDHTYNKINITVKTSLN